MGLNECSGKLQNNAFSNSILTTDTANVTDVIEVLTDGPEKAKQMLCKTGEQIFLFQPSLHHHHS